MQNQNELTYYPNGQAAGFSGPQGIDTFRAFVIASALRLYAKTGMKANRAYTPSNMLAAASAMTGKKYKRGQYEQAANDLAEYGNKLKASLPHRTV